MLNLRPIVSALRQHKSAVGILLLEIALTCAILCNALFLIQNRLEGIRIHTGVDEAHLVNISLTGAGKQSDELAQTRTDLAALRALPGVANAALITQLPLVSGSWNSSVSSAPEGGGNNSNTTLYMGGEQVRETLDVRLVAGRDFTPEDFVDVPNMEAFNSATTSVRAVLITQTLAKRLYPGENAVGKPLYMGNATITIVGVIDDLLRPAHHGWSASQSYNSTLLPVRLPYSLANNYLIRIEPGSTPDTVLKAASDKLLELDSRRILAAKQSYGEIRSAFFAQDRVMIWLLGIVMVILLAVTAFGIVGLASFWVQQRTRQIGIRRALGATRGDILRYFQSENFLIVSGGIVLGMLLAYGLNQFLMSHYELPRLPWHYLPIGAVALWLLGQLAVLAPALRAASIPPATATRSV